MSLDDISTKAKEILAIVDKLKQVPVPTPTPVPVPIPVPTPPVGRKIIVNALNFRQKLQNIDHVDFTGTTDKYIQVNKEHNILELPCDFLNVAVSSKVFVLSSTQKYVIQQYGRGGHHSDKTPCDGCAYKGRFGATISTFVKEINHPAYCGDRSSTSIPYTKLIGRWAVLMTTIKNTVRNTVEVVNYVDGKQVAIYEDKGDWSAANDPDYNEGCPPRQFGNTGMRKPNEILNKAGSLVSLRSDADTVYRLEEFKVEELL